MIVRIGVFFFAILFFSCATEPRQLELSGSYHEVSDSCPRLTFYPNQRVEYEIFCDSQEVIGLPKCFSDTLSYRIDSVDEHGGLFIFAQNDRDEDCYALHVQAMKDALVVTPLKGRSGLKYHMTSTVVLASAHASNDIHFDKELIIRLKNPVCDSVIYLAYSQLGIQNHRQTENGVIIDLENECPAFKTDYEIDPSYLAFEQYKFELFNPNTNDYDNVPVIYDEGYLRYRELDDDAKRLFLQQQNIHGPHFIVAYRFNPDRERVVNKVYGVPIVGQVQTFEYVRTE